MKTNIQIAELAAGEFFYGALRKPDFQRETADWSPQRVLGLIKSFIEGDLIPAVIVEHDAHRRDAATPLVADTLPARSSATFGGCTASAAEALTPAEITTAVSGRLGLANVVRGPIAKRSNDAASDGSLIPRARGVAARV
jgi:hypothetical protein